MQKSMSICLDFLLFLSSMSPYFVENRYFAEKETALVVIYVFLIHG